MVFSELFAGVISHVVFAESVSRVLRRVYTFASPSVWVNEIESFSLCCTYMTRALPSTIASNLITLHIYLRASEIIIYPLYIRKTPADAILS